MALGALTDGLDAARAALEDGDAEAGFSLLLDELRRGGLPDALNACAIALTGGVAVHTRHGLARSGILPGLKEVVSSARAAFPEDPVIMARAAEAAAIARKHDTAAELFRQAFEARGNSPLLGAAKGLANLATVAEAADKGLGRPPRIVIIGGQKCGSTTLAATLGSHPAVQQGQRRETHFFDWERVHACGRRWYRAYFARAAERRRWGLEKTPSYLAQPLALERMARLLPGTTRFLVILRDPVRRAWSGYYDDRRRAERLGGPPPSLEEFRTLMTAGWSVPAGGVGDLGPLGRSYYGPQLRQAREILGAERVHVLSLEELMQAPDETLGQVQDALGLQRRPLQVVKRQTEKGRTLELPDALRRDLAPIFAASDAEAFDLIGRQLY